jgi:hypothetical protein
MVEQNSKADLVEKLLAYRQQLIQNPEKASHCFIGFDGFTDEIIQAVDTRIDRSQFHPLITMSDFGNRIVNASGKSCNIELVVQQKKLGGNAPIMTNALLQGGHRITFAGAIGIPNKIEPLFQEMASQCERVIPLSPSGHSDAIEFNDGKIILGKFDQLLEISYNSLLEHLGRETLFEILDKVDLFVSANWTMLPMMTDMWQNIENQLSSKFTKRKGENPRWMFVDIADPKKRTDSDIMMALETLQKLEGPFQVILGLNYSEAQRICSVLGENVVGKNPESLQTLASSIQSRLKLYQVVTHSPLFAATSTTKETEFVSTYYTEKPFLTTGAGDNFNAGFCNALLYKLSAKEMLMSGVGTSGYYVRKGKSPTISELAAFLKGNENI